VRMAHVALGHGDGEIPWNVHRRYLTPNDPRNATSRLPPGAIVNGHFVEAAGHISGGPSTRCGPVRPFQSLLQIPWVPDISGPTVPRER
jgi:hypothetical protein